MESLIPDLLVGRISLAGLFSISATGVGGYCKYYTLVTSDLLFGTSQHYHVYYNLLLVLGRSTLFVTMVPFNTAWPTLLSVQWFCSFQILIISSQSMVCHFLCRGKITISVSKLQESRSIGPQNTLKCGIKRLRFQKFPGEHALDPPLP